MTTRHFHFIRCQPPRSQSKFSLETTEEEEEMMTQTDAEEAQNEADLSRVC